MPRGWTTSARAAAVVAALALVVASACSGGDPAPSTGASPAAPAASASADALELSGGAQGTVRSTGATAFGQGMEALTNDERRAFAVGNSFFNQNWVTAPASTEARDGLGPLFNAQSCSSCHFEDGRAQPPTSVDDPERGLLFKLSAVDEDGSVGPHPTYGSQFQDRSIRGVPAEGTVAIEVVEEPGRYPDGEAYSLGRPVYTLRDADGAELDDVLVSPRIAPAMFGVGLLEHVPEATILAAADPDDADGDGISGRAHLVPDPATGQQVLGRFGWKAATPTVRAQTVAAAANDIGITSDEVPDQPCTERQAACLAAPGGGEPEIAPSTVDRIVFYSRTLAVPARRDVGEPATAAGEAAFAEVGCASCHTPELKTGDDADIDALNGQVIRPYTDLLLHDLGPGLADERPDGDATGREWRTAPLWGIGLVETVNGHTRFLHDGRARDLEEAILWHGGEADASRRAFEALSAADRRALLTFLASL